MVNELTQAPTFPVFRVVEGIAVVMASDGLWLLFHRLRWNVSPGPPRHRAWRKVHDREAPDRRQGDPVRSRQ
jgi:hypothetical protein